MAISYIHVTSLVAISCAVKDTLSYYGADGISERERSAKLDSEDDFHVPAKGKSRQDWLQH